MPENGRNALLCQESKLLMGIMYKNGYAYSSLQRNAREVYIVNLCIVSHTADSFPEMLIAQLLFSAASESCLLLDTCVFQTPPKST